MKGLTNSITVGSGLSGGFIGPSVIMGLFLGAAMAQFFGIQANSRVYYALLVAGMSGVLSGSLNAPIAAAIIGTEIFGAEYAVPATLSSIISFQNRLRKRLGTPGGTMTPKDTKMTSK